MKVKQLLWLLWILLGLAACSEAPAMPPSVTAMPPDIVGAATAMQTPAATVTNVPATSVPASATATSAPVEPSPTTVPPALPAPTLMTTAWDDREPFRTGLVPGQEVVLNALPGATVYHIALDISEPTRITGQMEARYTNQEQEPLSELILHRFPDMLGGEMTVSNVRLNGQAAAVTIEPGIMRVALPRALQPGQELVLSMAFTTAVPGDSGPKYNVLSYVNETLALAHFYPMFAVYDETGWHTEPTAPHGDETFADSSYYLVEITAPAGQVVVSSGVPIASSNQGGIQQMIVAAGPMRDFYLAANPNYEVVSANSGPVQINSYAVAENQAGARAALETAAAALTSYSERFGDYPFTEMDIVTTATRALGIEYPGIFANAERIYDLAGSSGGLPNGVLLESTTAHETAHQWFYSLVGSDQLNEPWLDESVTQYATYLYFVDRYGEDNAQGFLDSLEGRWANAQNRFMPIGLPAEAYSGQDYGAIVYGRGPLFLLALAGEMGQDNLDRFLQTYVSQNRYEIASTETFRALAEATCDCDLGPLFEAWVYP